MPSIDCLSCDIATTFSIKKQHEGPAGLHSDVMPLSISLVCSALPAPMIISIGREYIYVYVCCFVQYGISLVEFKGESCGTAKAYYQCSCR